MKQLIQKLEEQISFLQRDILKMSDEMFNQQKDILRLTSEIREFREKLSDLEKEGGTDSQKEPLPPHY